MLAGLFARDQVRSVDQAAIVPANEFRSSKRLAELQINSFTPAVRVAPWIFDVKNKSCVSKATAMKRLEGAYLDRIGSGHR